MSDILIATASELAKFGDKQLDDCKVVKKETGKWSVTLTFEDGSRVVYSIKGTDKIGGIVFGDWATEEVTTVRKNGLWYLRAIQDDGDAEMASQFYKNILELTNQVRVNPAKWECRHGEECHNAACFRHFSDEDFATIKGLLRKRGPVHWSEIFRRVMVAMVDDERFPDCQEFVHYVLNECAGKLAASIPIQEDGSRIRSFALFFIKKVRENLDDNAQLDKLQTLF